jgi:glycosyltransferase involved in cell wall biosynthesis
MTTPSVTTDNARQLDDFRSAEQHIRLGVLSTHLIQYYAPLYRALSSQVDELEVLYFRSVGAQESAAMHDTGFGRSITWDVNLTDGYGWMSLGLAEAPFSYSNRDYLRLAAGVRRWAQTFKPDVVLVPGWTTPYLICAATLDLMGVRLITRPEGRQARRRGVRGFARNGVVRTFLRRTKAAAVIGTAARDELMLMGVPESACFASPYTIDDHWWKMKAQEGLEQRLNLRQAWGVQQDTTVFVTVGKMLPYKNPLLLVEVFADVHKRNPKTHLVFVGDGALRERVRDRINALGIGSSVSMLGFVNQSALPEVLVASDVFVMPSRETWGLAANEAAACGLPLAVSLDAGCARDLIVDGVTGFRLSLGHRSQMVERLLQLTEPSLRASMHEPIRRLAASYTIEAASQGIADAAQYAMASDGGSGE